MLEFPSSAFGDDAAKQEYEKLMKREEELIGFEPQSMFTPKIGSHGWDKFERDQIYRDSGMEPPVLPPRDAMDAEGWSNYLKESELKRIRERKEEIRQRAFDRGDGESAPAPKPSPKPKPEHGPFPEGDPRNHPAPKKSPPPPGVGPYGPEPLPAEDPNQLQAKAPLQFDGLLGRQFKNPSIGPRIFQDQSFSQGASSSNTSSAAAPSPD